VSWTPGSENPFAAKAPKNVQQPSHADAAADSSNETSSAKSDQDDDQPSEEEEEAAEEAPAVPADAAPAPQGYVIVKSPSCFNGGQSLTTTSHNIELNQLVRKPFKNR
jgi:hypothetical protein